MKQVLKWIEMVLQVVTLIIGVLTVVQGIKTYLYQKQLKSKANVYLEDELELEGNIRGPVTVDSPTLHQKKEQVMQLLALTGIGCLGIMIVNVIKRVRD